MNVRFLLSLSILGLSTMLSPSKADTIIDPIDAMSNSSYGSTPPNNMINGSGFTAAQQLEIANGATTPSIYPTSMGGNGYAVWFSDGTDTPVTLTFTLSATPVDVSGIHFWNYDADSIGRSITSFAVSFSADGITYSTPETFSNLETETADNTPTAGQTLTLSSTATDVEYARFTNLTHGNDSYESIEEVRFIAPSAAAAPEPSTQALLTAGALLLACLVRRRQAAFRSLSESEL